MENTFKIVIDSRNDLEREYIINEHLEELAVDESTHYPSLHTYMESFDTNASHIYVLTPSSYYSESYNSAITAAYLYEEENNTELNIHVIDFSATKANIMKMVDKIIQLEKCKSSFEEIVGQIEVLKNSFAFA